ncbi:MAG: adenylyltransferase/cytidyltransferase family protein [Rhodospirillales bacterium]|nr:adenylyltransferase/cytidyltransferase family protein [Rhodospirillales bacterium]MBO6787731.1 adenylyltransferase/cytidyltransferase family protein [Rhodospirillales bacterium]
MTSNETDIRNKIKTLEEIGRIVAEAKKAGKTVAHCHGVFDLVHLGHVRHLEVARREADILVVTITTDGHVNKGPGRPVFTENLRAEMLGALEYVDYVGISREPSAELAIETIKPDIFVKGSDYQNAADDITGKINVERKAVESHGGRIVFTDDITFSSSELINRYMDVHDESLRAYLNECSAEGMEQTVRTAIGNVEKKRVLLVGDAIIDEYHYVQAMAKAPKENMIATRNRYSEIFAGGILAAANHVADFCDTVEVITMLGRRNSYEDLIREQIKPNVDLHFIYRDDVPTTRKTRYIDEGYMRKLFEVYDFDDSPPGADLEQQIQESIKDHAPAADVTIATDFGHGMLGGSAIEALQTHAKFLAVNTQTNSANLGYNLITKYRKCDFVCIDAPEARLASGDRFSDLESIVVNNLAKRIDCNKFIITHGQHGCVIFENGAQPKRIPAFTRTVVDTVGAGDAFLVVSSPLAALDIPLEVAGFVGNAAGAMKVGIVGHQKSVEKIPLMKYIRTLLK